MAKADYEICVSVQSFSMKMVTDGVTERFASINIGPRLTTTIIIHYDAGRESLRESRSTIL